MTKKEIAWNKGYGQGYMEGAADITGQAIVKMINEYVDKDITLITCANGSNDKYLNLLLYNILHYIPAKIVERIIDLGKERLERIESLRKRSEENGKI